MRNCEASSADGKTKEGDGYLEHLKVDSFVLYLALTNHIISLISAVYHFLAASNHSFLWRCLIVIHQNSWILDELAI